MTWVDLFAICKSHVFQSFPINFNLYKISSYAAQRSKLHLEKKLNQILVLICMCGAQVIPYLVDNYDKQPKKPQGQWGDGIRYSNIVQLWMACDRDARIIVSSSTATSIQMVMEWVCQAFHYYLHACILSCPRHKFIVKIGITTQRFSFSTICSCEVS